MANTHKHKESLETHKYYGFSSKMLIHKNSVTFIVAAELIIIVHSLLTF